MNIKIDNYSILLKYYLYIYDMKTSVLPRCSCLPLVFWFDIFYWSACSHYELWTGGLHLLWLSIYSVSLSVISFRLIRQSLFTLWVIFLFHWDQLRGLWYKSIVTHSLAPSKRAFIKILMHVFWNYCSSFVFIVFVHVNIFDFDLAIGVWVCTCLVNDRFKMRWIITTAFTTETPCKVVTH